MSKHDGRLELVEGAVRPADRKLRPGEERGAEAEPASPYLGLERRLRVPLQHAGAWLLEPLIALLSRLGISPNAVSAAQVLLAAGVFYTLPRWPATSLLLLLAAAASDAVDGMLARRLGRTSTFGMLWDQACDHAREALVVAALAHYGLVRPLWATVYAFAYPALNLAILLSNRYAVPLALAVRNYLFLYPALVVFLGWGINALNLALALTATGMAAGCGVVLWRLYRVMP